ncbi:MAG: hypothetical protein KAJ14_02100 [Candidatus Omnitrophica bacterium]|nr:hypothetical protein [Candidatus Omnitrophota bacterium]
MRKFFTLPILIVAIIIVFACGGNEIEFTPEKDNAAMAKIERTWVSGGFNISLTEDILTADTGIDSDSPCQVIHVVRSGGRTPAHTEDTPPYASCGGCPRAIYAFIMATVQGGPFLEPMQLKGSIKFGDISTGDPYNLPYPILLNGNTNSTNCKIDGNILGDGKLEITVKFLSNEFLSNEIIWLTNKYTM